MIPYFIETRKNSTPHFYGFNGAFPVYPEPNAENVAMRSDVSFKNKRKTSNFLALCCTKSGKKYSKFT